MDRINLNTFDTELRNYWLAARELADARRNRHTRAIRNAAGEIEAIAMHTAHPALRNAARRMLAA